MEKEENKELIAKLEKAIQHIDVAGTSKGYKNKIAKSVAELLENYADEKTKELQSDNTKLLIRINEYMDTINSLQSRLDIATKTLEVVQNNLQPENISDMSVDLAKFSVDNVLSQLKPKTDE